MKKFIKNNIKVLISFILGSVIFGTMVYAATGPSGSDVSYSNTSSKLTSTNAKAAIDELNEKAKTKTLIDIDFGSLKTNFEGAGVGTILASSKGICIKKNNKVHCFKPNNWNEEKQHIYQVFDGCSVNQYNGHCNDPDFYFTLDIDGYIDCRDKTDDSYCSIDETGSIHCDLL